MTTAITPNIKQHEQLPPMASRFVEPAFEQTYLLEGTLICGEGTVTPGNFVWRPAGSRHEAWGTAAKAHALP